MNRPACRSMPTRRCPGTTGCPALCARLESDDATPWAAAPAQQFDADSVLKLARDSGLQLTDGQVRVIRAMASDQLLVSHPRRNGMNTVRRLIDEARRAAAVSTDSQATPFFHYTG